MGPGDLAVSQADLDQLGITGLTAVLGVRQHGIDVDDGGVFKQGGEEMLLLALDRGAEPLRFDLVQGLAGGQGLIQQRDGLVQRTGEHERLVHALAGRLAALRVGGRGHAVLDFLHQDLIFVTFLINVTDRIGSESTLGDIALGPASDGNVCGCGHDRFLMSSGATMALGPSR